MDVAAVVEQVDAELRARGTPERAAKERSYLKSGIEHYGASVPAIRAVATGVKREHPDIGHDDLVAIATRLWAVPVHERRMAAGELLDVGGDLLGPDDLALVERFLRDSRTWALVDTLAPSVAGQIVERYPESAVTLDRWAADADFWLRRAALLALLPALRQGGGDFERFGRYADAMLDEREFFVRKAIGWVLRDTGRRRPELVFEWLLPRASRTSTVTLREALKPLDEEHRATIQAARAGPGGLSRRSR